MRSSNQLQQLQAAQDHTELLQSLYNDPVIITSLQAASREQSLAVLLRVYNIHHALIMAGLQFDNGPQVLDAHDALRMLRIAVTAAWGPWRASIALRGGITSYHRARLYNSGTGVQAVIGWQRGSGPNVPVRVATFNMQGVSAFQTDKFRAHLLQHIRQHHVIALQEAGVPPISARHEAQLSINDQFGVAHEVNRWRWEAGTAGRMENYMLYYLEVDRQRVRLALMVGSDVTVTGVTVIADGARSLAGLQSPRPVLGLRITLPGLNAEMTVYSFHAISGGGPNSPRVLREVAWHTDTPFMLLGDFNRDPRAPAPAHPNSRNWVSPQGIAELVPAAGPTHPSNRPTYMLNYSLAYGMAVPAAPGQVLALMDSDHRMVSFTFTFCD
ncbi:endonuclease/exonuclease/phosphatase family protein [Pseudomonas sp. PSKL.D1]|uniref:endonuclease/exonuclease/phosphatase family protein n=1 Tax=Pseudomonas sp. PSKL.D1 TaxID=3029060 RepID=UPI00238143F1|nr:endonuclease/exonuclease/phosphatase family protein [Pseudomonas sp. PSKL.D1]WDY56196.1 endonuclease/exonuclease/phosphatase family protein [Pseudomonas sp. PSKL.D1]